MIIFHLYISWHIVFGLNIIGRPMLRAARIKVGYTQSGVVSFALDLRNLQLFHNFAFYNASKCIIMTTIHWVHLTFSTILSAKKLFSIILFLMIWTFASTFTIVQYCELTNTPLPKLPSNCETFSLNEANIIMDNLRNFCRPILYNISVQLVKMLNHGGFRLKHLSTRP